MRMRSRYLPVSVLLILFVASVFVLAPRSHAGGSAQDPPATPPAGGAQERPNRPDQTAEPRPYDR